MPRLSACSSAMPNSVAYLRTSSVFFIEQNCRLVPTPGSRGAGMFPRFTVFAAQPLHGFPVVRHDAFLWVIGNRPADLHTDVGEDAARGGDVTFLDVGDRAAAFLDGGEEVEHVPTRGGRGVQFNVLLGHVLWIFLLFIHALEVEGLGVLVERDEVSAHGARFERAFLPVDEERPRVVGIRRGAPGAMLPHT